MRNARLDEAQDGIKIARRNMICRYAENTTLTAESKEELKSPLMKVKEESEKAGLKLSIQKTKIMASSPITSWQTYGKQWKQWETLFWGAPKSLQMVTEAMKLKGACSLEERLEQTWRWKWSHSVMSDCFSPPWTVVCQAPASMGFSRQELWSGLPFPSPVHESEKWKWRRSVVSDSATPWTAAYQAPASMGFSRQEYWSGLPLPSPTERHLLMMKWRTISWRDLSNFLFQRQKKKVLSKLFIQTVKNKGHLELPLRIAGGCIKFG